MRINLCEIYQHHPVAYTSKPDFVNPFVVN